MTLLAGGNYPPAAKFPNVGSKVSGLVVDWDEIPETVFGDRSKVKTFKNGDTIMQLRVTLEQPDESQVSVYIAGKAMKDAARDALKDAGVRDLEAGGFLSFTKTAGNGTSAVTNEWDAEYAPPAA